MYLNVTGTSQMALTFILTMLVARCLRLSSTMSTSMHGFRSVAWYLNIRRWIMLMSSTYLHGLILRWPCIMHACILKFLVCLFDADVDRERRGKKSSEYSRQGGKDGRVYGVIIFQSFRGFYKGNAELHKRRQD